MDSITVWNVLAIYYTYYKVLPRKIPQDGLTCRYYQQTHKIYCRKPSCPYALLEIEHTIDF